MFADFDLLFLGSRLPVRSVTYPYRAVGRGGAGTLVAARLSVVGAFTSGSYRILFAASQAHG